MPEEQQEKRAKGDCPLCGKDRWAKVLGEKDEEWSAEDDTPVWGRDTYRLLECAGCERVYYQHISLFSENMDYTRSGEPLLKPDTVYYPSLSKRECPPWVWSLATWGDHPILGAVFESLYKAIDHDLTILAASGVRTVFDLATTELGIDPALSFSEKINELKSQGRIGLYEQNDLSTMIDAANAAMHRGWKPSSEELDTMMTTLERFVHNSFEHEGKAAKLK